MAPSSFTVIALRNIFKNVHTYAGSIVIITTDKWQLEIRLAAPFYRSSTNRPFLTREQQGDDQFHLR